MAALTFDAFKDNQFIESVKCEGKPSYLVGRDSDHCEFALAHPSISRQHARISLDSFTQLMMLSDLGSTHHTFVNGRKLQRGVPVKIIEGSKIRFGSSRRVWLLKTIVLSDTIEKRLQKKSESQQLVIPEFAILAYLRVLRGNLRRQGLNPRVDGYVKLDTLTKHTSLKKIFRYSPAQVLETISVEKNGTVHGKLGVARLESTKIDDELFVRATGAHIETTDEKLQVYPLTKPNSELHDIKYFCLLRDWNVIRDKGICVRKNSTYAHFAATLINEDQSDVTKLINVVSKFSGVTEKPQICVTLDASRFSRMGCNLFRCHDDKHLVLSQGNISNDVIPACTFTCATYLRSGSSLLSKHEANSVWERKVEELATIQKQKAADLQNKLEEESKTERKRIETQKSIEEKAKKLVSSDEENKKNNPYMLHLSDAQYKSGDKRDKPTASENIDNDGNITFDKNDNYSSNEDESDRKKVKRDELEAEAFDDWQYQGRRRRLNL